MMIYHGKSFITICLASLLVVACAKRDVTPEDVAGKAAEAYYGYLIDGKYDDFVGGMAHYKDMPENYRSQLADNAKMFVAQQQKQHQGVRDMRVDKVDVDKEKQVANVFLVFEYNDDSVEQVLVPMVMEKGLWVMR